MATETKVLIGIGITTLVIVITAAYFIGGKPTASVANTKPIENVDALVRKDSHSEGPDNAKVVFVEFADFQCPGCAVASPIVKQLRGEYKGKIKYVFRQYPLQMHQYSNLAAQSAESAGGQGKFFEMEDKLFSGQDEWSVSQKPLDIFIRYAKEIGLDTEKFKKGVESEKYAKKVEADIKDGNAIGIDYTPTFFINGVKQEGGIDYKTYKNQFDELLK